VNGDNFADESPGARAQVEGLYEFFAEQLDQLRRMPSTFASVRAGLRLVVEPDDLISIVLGKLVDRLFAAPDRDELLLRSAKFRSLGYVYKAMEHEAIDRARVATRHTAWPDDYPDRSDGIDEADERRDAMVASTRRLGVIISTLRDRSGRAAPPTTCLTNIHQACLAAVKEGRGSQSSLAAALGVDDSRISQIKKQVTGKIKETIYIAGILGPECGLDQPELINAALDVYDGTAPERVLSSSQRAKLTAASAEVRTKIDHGQRADPGAAAALYLRRKDKKGVRDDIAAGGASALQAFTLGFGRDLHDAESAHAVACRVTHPNCSACCSPHNPDPDRIVWPVDAL
jgi:hypothetical protein